MMINEHLIKALRLLYNKGMDERETHNDHDDVMKLWEAHRVKADVVQVVTTRTVSVVNLAIDDIDVFLHNSEWFLNEDGELHDLFKAYEAEEELEGEAYKLALRGAGATAAECAATGTYEGTLWLMWEGEDTHWSDINPNELYPNTPEGLTNHNFLSGDVIVFGKCEFFVGGEDETTEIVSPIEVTGAGPWSYVEPYEPNGDSGLHD
jgi:hypothetical protein